MGERSSRPWRFWRDAWLSELRADPGTTRAMLAVATYFARETRRERGNRYRVSRDELVRALGLSPRTVQRACSQLVERGWLLRCGGVGPGHPQRWHRSHPYDPARSWGLVTCPRCGWLGSDPHPGTAAATRPNAWTNGSHGDSRSVSRSDSRSCVIGHVFDLSGPLAPAHPSQPGRTSEAHDVEPLTLPTSELDDGSTVTVEVGPVRVVVDTAAARRPLSVVVPDEPDELAARRRRRSSS